MVASVTPLEERVNMGLWAAGLAKLLCKQQDFYTTPSILLRANTLPFLIRRKIGSLLSKEDEAEGSVSFQAQLRAETHHERGGLNEHLHVGYCDPPNADSQIYTHQEGNRKTCFIENLMNSRGKIQRCGIRSSSIKGPASLPQGKFTIKMSHLQTHNFPILNCTHEARIG